MTKTFLTISARDWRTLGGVWLIWRVGLYLVGWLAPFLLKYQPSFPYAYTLLPKYGLPQWLYSWANFDGVHYLTIAEKGYLGTGLIQAFFPLYPLSMAGMNWLTHNSILSGLLISSVASFLLFVVWFGYIKDMFDAHLAWYSLILFLVFPTSFFLGAVYSESLFLLVVVGAFWAAYRRMWWLAGLFAILASAGRVVGVGLVPALFISWLTSDQRKVRDLIPVLAGALGLAGYMLYLERVFHDPLYFFHVQSEFGAGRQESLVFYPQVVWRYVKIIATYQPHDLKYLTLIFEAVAGTVGAVALALSAKKVPLSWTIFSGLAFILPTLTGSFSSLSRYILVCFSLWIWLAMGLQSSRWRLGLYLLLSIGILVLNTVLFIQGYWVA